MMVDIDKFICDLLKGAIDPHIDSHIRAALRKQDIIYKDGSLQRLSIVEENGKNCEEKDRIISGIPVINDDKFMPYDESIHYDPCKFKPFDKVLVRFDDDDRWEAELFSSYDSHCDNPFHCIGLAYPQCIPYLGNEVLLGTTGPCDKYYCSWDDNKVKY